MQSVLLSGLLVLLHIVAIQNAGVAIQNAGIAVVYYMHRIQNVATNTQYSKHNQFSITPYP